MRISRRCALTSTLIALLSSVAVGQDSFYLHDGDTVVFYGDSITDQRLYTTFVETYTVTRFPTRKIRFVHSGWGGDRVSGGGGGPVATRLQRDVYPYKPTVMTIMLGMNDGRVRAFDETIFNEFAGGYASIVKNVKAALPGIRITAIQPSPYDDVTQPPKFPGGYNEVLVRYGAYLNELGAKEQLTVADMNGPVVEDLKSANRIDSRGAAKLIPDRVHPGPGGHLLMAKALLKAWSASALVSAVEIEATGAKVKQAVNTDVSMFAGSPTGLRWTQIDKALPFPLDGKDAGVVLAVKASDVEKAMDRETLQVHSLKAGRYALRIDGKEVGSFTAEQLASGINLAMLATPMSRQAAEVHALTLKHNQIHFARWREVQVPLEKDGLTQTDAAMAALDRLEDEVVQKQRSTAQPKPHQMELVSSTAP